MTEVISLLESCKTEAAQAPSAPDGAAKTLPLRVFDNSPLKRTAPPKTEREPSIAARREELDGLQFNADMSLEDLVMDVRPEGRPALPPRAAKPPSTKEPALKRRGAGIPLPGEEDGCRVIARGRCGGRCRSRTTRRVLRFRHERPGFLGRWCFRRIDQERDRRRSRSVSATD